MVKRFLPAVIIILQICVSCRPTYYCECTIITEKKPIYYNDTLFQAGSVDEYKYSESMKSSKKNSEKFCKDYNRIDTIPSSYHNLPGYSGGLTIERTICGLK